MNIKTRIERMKKSNSKFLPDVQRRMFHSDTYSERDFQLWRQEFAVAMYKKHGDKRGPILLTQIQNPLNHSEFEIVLEVRPRR